MMDLKMLSNMGQILKMKLKFTARETLMHVAEKNEST